MKKRNTKSNAISGKKKNASQNNFSPKKIKGGELKKSMKNRKIEAQETQELAKRFKSFIDKDQEIANIAEQKKRYEYKSQTKHGKDRNESGGNTGYYGREDRNYSNRYGDNQKDKRKTYFKQEESNEKPYLKRNSDYSSKRETYSRKDEQEKNPNYSNRSDREDKPFSKSKTGYPNLKKRTLGHQDEQDRPTNYTYHHEREERTYPKRKTGFPVLKKRIFTSKQENIQKERPQSDENREISKRKENKLEQPSKQVKILKKRLIIPAREEKPDENNHNKNEWEDRRNYSDHKGFIRKPLIKRIDRKLEVKKRVTLAGKQDIKTPVSVYEELRTTGMRLNKYVASAGTSSRRQADELIAAGKITVNNEVITAMGHKVFDKDVVRYNGKVLNPAPLVYVLLNKPKNIITTARDPEGRLTVLDLVKNATEERLYPVGRLDRNTTGLLLLTNDGELAQKLSHPSSEVPKIYFAILDRPLLKQDLDKISKGVILDDGLATVDEIAYVNANDRSEVGISIHSGRNRVVRRIFEHIGYEVQKLDRVMYANLTKKDLPRGRWRLLAPKEVLGLKLIKAQKQTSEDFELED